LDAAELDDRRQVVDVSSVTIRKQYLRLRRLFFVVQVTGGSTWLRWIGNYNQGSALLAQMTHRLAVKGF
jgi:hypothetical protein